MAPRKSTLDSEVPDCLDEGELRCLELFEHAGSLVFLVDPAGRFLFANQALRELLGYEAQELSGLTIFDLTRRTDHALCQGWLSPSDPSPAASDARIVFLSRDGREVPAEGFTSARIEDRKVRFLRGVFRDLTREQRAETALRESAELFNLLSHHTPLGLFRIDPSGRLTYTSSRWRQMAGLTHVAQPRGLWWQMVHPCDRNRVLADWHGAVSHRLEFETEFRVHLTGPHPRWCRTRISLSAGPEGTVRGGIGTAEDVTEYRQAVQALRRAHDDMEERVRSRTSELEAANRELAEFAYVVSHDLKAPLRGVSLLSEWLAQDYAAQLGPEGVGLFDKLRHRVQEMHALVDGVLAYTRIGHAVEDDVEIHLGRLLLDVVQSLGSPEGIRFDFPSSLPGIRGRPQQVRQVFQNLLDNAVKFMGKPEGTVSVHARREAAGWEFAVVDTGPGIDARHHTRIFQIFQRLDPGRNTPGTGIGLSLVKRIIDARGGRIAVESGEGSGTTFRFIWPDEPRRDSSGT